MKKNLSIKELEDFVFSNKIIQSKLPKYKFLFDGWRIAQSSPSLKSLATRCLLDFSSLVTEEDLKIIKDELNVEVSVPSLAYNHTKFFKTDIDKLEFLLEDVSNYTETVLYRKGKEIRVLLWR